MTDSVVIVHDEPEHVVVAHDTQVVTITHAATDVVKVVDGASSVVVEETAPAVVVVRSPAAGPQGDKGNPGDPGPKGDQGDRGPAGPAGGAEQMIYVQSVSSALWTITHNLGKNPFVNIIDSANQTVYAEVDYPTSNTVTISFGSAMSGTAYLI